MRQTTPPSLGLVPLVPVNSIAVGIWLREERSNLCPCGYEPHHLPSDCIPHQIFGMLTIFCIRRLALWPPPWPIAARVPWVSRSNSGPGWWCCPTLKRRYEQRRIAGSNRDRMQPCYFRKSCVRIAGTANNLITHLAENHVLTVPCSQSAPLFRFYVSCPKKHAMTARGSHSAMWFYGNWWSGGRDLHPELRFHRSTWSYFHQSPDKSMLPWLHGQCVHLRLLMHNGWNSKVNICFDLSLFPWINWTPR